MLSMSGSGMVSVSETKEGMVWYVRRWCCRLASGEECGAAPPLKESRGILETVWRRYPESRPESLSAAAASAMAGSQRRLLRELPPEVMHCMVLMSKVAACLLRADRGSSLLSIGLRTGEEVKGVE